MAHIGILFSDCINRAITEIAIIVKKIKNNIAEIEIMNIKKDVDISLVPDVKIGDFVIVHAGFAINKIDENEALEALKVLREIAESI